MADLSANFAGLKLSSPIIVASAGITETIERMKRCQDHGAGAVVMKSYFEEVVSRRSPTPRFKIIHHNLGNYRSFTLYSYEQASEWDIYRYADEVSRAKAKLKIKVIPSINCCTDEGWIESAKILEQAGADAIELNTSCPHGSITFRGKAVEETIFHSVRLVRESVNVPLIAKISPMLTSPIGVVKELENIGVNAVTIFNRMTGLDIDIDTERPVMHGGYAGHGGPWAIHYALRWISEIRPKVNIDIAGSGGVTDWRDVVKYILAGANVVQVCTAIIINGYEVIEELLRGLDKHMDSKGYERIDDFIGKASRHVLGTTEIDRRKKAVALINYDEHLPPCVFACPAHVPAQAYVKFIAKGSFKSAVNAIRSKNPFQSVCAYICNHICESNCTRALIDKPVAIRALKRFALEWAQKNDVDIDISPKAPPSGRRIAIIGSGATGLTAAYELAKNGHEVIVFEKEAVAGGKMRELMIKTKAPVYVLDNEIELIKGLGVTIQLSSNVGDDVSLNDIKADAILIATGTKTELDLLGLPGEVISNVDKVTMMSSIPGLFFSGDIIRSSGYSVIRAVADGKDVSISIDRYLKGEAYPTLPELKPVDKRDGLVRSTDKPTMPRVNVRRVDGVEQTLTEDEAIYEASRCLGCGCGVGCDRCYQVCIYSGISMSGTRYTVNQNCDGCGLCVEICPNKAIKMIPIEVK